MARAKSTGSPKNAGGRPRREVDLAAVERMGRIGCTYEEIATLLGYTKRGVLKRVTIDEVFREALERGQAGGRETLRRMQWKAMENGNPTMLIWLGKQMLGQRDSPAFVASFGERNKKAFPVKVSFDISPEEKSEDSGPEK